MEYDWDLSSSSTFSSTKNVLLTNKWTDVTTSAGLLNRSMGMAAFMVSNMSESTRLARPAWLYRKRSGLLNSWESWNNSLWACNFARMRSDMVWVSLRE